MGRTNGFQKKGMTGHILRQSCHLFSADSYAAWGITIFVCLAKRLGSALEEVLKQLNVDDVVSPQPAKREWAKHESGAAEYKLKLRV